jgi:hypothetical protein
MLANTATSHIPSGVARLVRRSTLIALATAVTAVAISLGAASPANAARVIKCDAYGSCVTVCRETLPNGNTVDYSEGTVVTFNYNDGTSKKYKCTNGNWVPVTGTLASGIIVTSFGGFTTPVAVTCPVGVRICAVPVATTAPAPQPQLAGV